MITERKTMSRSIVAAVRAEVKPLKDENRKLRATLRRVMWSATFCGEPLMEMTCKRSEAHPDSVCSLNLREALRARDLLNAKRTVK